MTVLCLESRDFGKAVFPCSDIAAFPSHSEQIQHAHLLVRHLAFFPPMPLRAQPCCEFRVFLPLCWHIGVSVGGVVLFQPFIHFTPLHIVGFGIPVEANRIQLGFSLCLKFP